MSLKKVVSGIIIGAFIFVGSTVQAQMLPKFGIKAGLNYSTFNNTDNAEYKTGFIGGVYTKINIPASPVAIQPELLYAQYGSDYENSEYSLDYIQIPILAKFGFGAPAVPIKPEVFFGPYAGFNINSDAENNPFPVGADELFKNTDWGVVVGAGVQVTKLNFELRYTAGLTNVFEDQYASGEDGEKNGAFSLTVGINF